MTTPWQAAGYSSQEEWAVAGWPAPLDPETGKPWEGWKMYRMERGRHPTGRKMTDEDWFNPYTQHILDFVRIRRLYDNPLWGWQKEMRAKYPDYPMPGINIYDLLRQQFPEWYGEQPRVQAAPTRVQAAPTWPSQVEKWLGLAKRLSLRLGEMMSATPAETGAAPRALGRAEAWLGWRRPEAPVAQGMAGARLPITPVPAPLSEAAERERILAEKPAVPMRDELIERAKALLRPPVAPAPIEREISPEVVAPGIQPPERQVAVPAIPSEIFTPLEIVERALEWLSPGYLKRTESQFIQPLREAGRIITNREALADDAHILLGEVNAEVQGYRLPPTEMRLPNLINNATVGFYYAWFDLVGGILKRGQDTGNLLMSFLSRNTEQRPLLVSPRTYLAAEAIGLHKRTPSEELERELANVPLPIAEELRQANNERDMVWSLLFMEPTFKEELRGQIDSGQITWEEVMSNYRNDNLELFMNLVISPWWFAPAGPFKVAFAPVTKPLGLAWRGLKATPVLGSLFELSRRTRIEKYADEAVRGWDKLMSRIPKWQETIPDASFGSSTKLDLEAFADDMLRTAKEGKIAETFGLAGEEGARLSKLIAFAEEGGFDLGNLIRTAGSKEAVLSRLRWMARNQKALELGVTLTRDRNFMTELMQFMKEQWLGPNPAFVAVNFLDNSVKALMHGFFPAGNYPARFAVYGRTVPTYAAETMIKAVGIEAETVTGRLGIPLMSKPEWWLRGYGIRALEAILPKEVTQPIVRLLGHVVDFTKRPEYTGLGKSLATLLEQANTESLVLAGRRGWNVEMAFRAEGILHKMNGIIETARPEFADDLYRAIMDIGLPETVAAGVRDAVRSRLVKSPDDIVRVLRRLYPEGKAPTYGLADYPINYSGKLGEVLGWLRVNLERIEGTGRATPESVAAQFAQARRMAQGIIDDVERTAEGASPISSVLGGIEDIIAVQGARRDVAVNRLGSLMHKVERAVLDGELPQSVLDDTSRIRDKVIFRGRKLIQGALRRTEQARRGMITEPLTKLANDLRAGRIDQAQFAIKYNQLVNSYKAFSGPYWDKVNDDFVRIISVGIDRIQSKANIFEEPLSLELMGKLARIEAIMKNIKATFREQVLGGWLDDATKLTDEIGRWEEWALGKLRPPRVAAPEVAEVARPAGEVVAPIDTRTKVAQLTEQYMRRWNQLLDDAMDEGIQYSKDIFFDYGELMALEDNVITRWSIPFIHWQLLNPVYWLKHAGEMPWIPNAVRLYEWETDQHRLERGLPARFKWTVEIPLHDWAPQFFPEGYYGMDIRPLMSMLTQLAMFSPYQEPFRYAEEDDWGKVLRAGEWIGVGQYPWVTALMGKITNKETPDTGDLFPITRALRDALGIDLGHITDIEDYYAKLELASRVSSQEIDEWTAKNAIMEGAGNPEYDNALEETQQTPKRILNLIRLWLPFTIKYGSPGELAIREELKAYGEAKGRGEVPLEPSAGLRTYWFLQKRRGETKEEYRTRQRNGLAYETYIGRINEMNKYLSAQAQLYGVGTKRWQDIVGQYWEDRERIRLEYEEAITPEMTDTMRWVLAAPLDSAVRSYRNMTRQFFDEEGNLKEGYDWGDVISAQEMFKRELVRGTPERRPISLLAFEQAYYKWEIPEEAVLRAWERLYARPVWDVINSTKELDRTQANALITEAKQIANRSRGNTAELEAEIIRIHPDWTQEQIARALRTELPTWDQWARRNDPLRDALTSVIWSGYMGLDDLARKDFRDYIEQHPDIDPRVSIIFEEVMLPREIEKAQRIWQRDMNLISTKVLLILADKLGGLIDLQREGFQREIEEAEREYELEPIEGEPEARGGRPPGLAALPEGPQPPLPPGETPAGRYPGGTFVSTRAPEEEANYDQAVKEMEAWVTAGKTGDWTPLMEKWFGDPNSPPSLFWDYYWSQIPPGRIANEVRQDPIIEMLLNKAFRTVYDVKPGVYEQALQILKTWREAHPGLPGDPQEWAIVRQITEKYWELKSAGSTNEASALWRYFAPLLEKYYPSEAREIVPRPGPRYRARRGGGGGGWQPWGGRWRRWPRIRYYPRR